MDLQSGCEELASPQPYQPLTGREIEPDRVLSHVLEICIHVDHITIFTKLKFIAEPEVLSLQY